MWMKNSNAEMWDGWQNCKQTRWISYVKPDGYRYEQWEKDKIEKGVKRGDKKEIWRDRYGEYWEMR